MKVRGIPQVITKHKCPGTSKKGGGNPRAPMSVSEFFYLYVSSAHLKQWPTPLKEEKVPEGWLARKLFYLKSWLIGKEV